MNGRTIGILGVGAIGSSVGLRARRSGARVLGADIRDDALSEAMAIGAIDEAVGASHLAACVEMLVIALPLEPTLRELERLAKVPHLLPALIVDVSAVKVVVARAAEGVERFVGTHPMAGTERSGPAAAREDMFEGRTWALVPSGDQPLDDRARTFIESMGATPFEVSAEDHDRAVALTSHAPQIIAWCLADAIRSEGAVAERLCGPVARELLRIAQMDVEKWRDVLSANADNLKPRLRALASRLDAAAGALKKGPYS